MKTVMKMDRKEKIIDLIANSDKPLSASKLAKEFGVSRQIIVGDIALLRASGHEIMATPRGYVFETPQDKGLKKTIAVKHTRENLVEELNVIVDNGGIVEDVIVEHPVYGEIKGNLHISSRYDVTKFMDKLSTSQAAPLSLVTNGVHLHTLIVPDEESFHRITEGLDAIGVLLK